jgi:predicted negative regulator of RcsB-dependent stress response
MDSEVSQSTTWYDFLGWLDTHRKQIIQVVSGVALAAVVISFIVWRSSQKEQAASSALIMLQLDSARTGSPRGEALRRFAADHESTQAGIHALLLAGGTLFTEGNYAEARTCFEQFLARTSDSPFAVQANFGIATTLEAEGKANEALAKYESISRLSREPLAERAKLAMARIHLSHQKPAEALKIYRQLASTPSPFQGEGQFRENELLRKHPELAPTNAPTIISTNVPAETPQPIQLTPQK